MSENLNYVGDGFEIRDGSLIIFNAEEYFGVDEFFDEEIAGQGDVVIPDGVVSIGRGAFAGCSWLRSVVIPCGVASIEAQAFKNCKNLADVLFFDEDARDSGTSGNGGICSYYDMGSNGTNSSMTDGAKGLKMIGREAFAGCVSLKSVKLPETVIFVGDRAFSGTGCANL